MSTNTITSLAMLKVNIDQGKDYLDYLKWAPKTGPQAKVYNGSIHQACGGAERWILGLFAALHVVLAIIIGLEIAGVLDWTK